MDLRTRRALAAVAEMDARQTYLTLTTYQFCRGG
jgi:hypothetical protein